MNPGLVWLLRRQPAAFVRSLLRRSGKGRRALVLVVGALFLAFVVASQVPQWMLAARDPERAALHARQAAAIVPLALTFMLVLVDLSGTGLYFRPAEIDFLFPAPVARRDLLLYQVLTRAGLAALSGLWTSIFVAKWAGTVAGGVLGAVLAIVFLQVSAQVASMAVAALGQRAALVRTVVWGAVAVLGAVGIRAAMASVPHAASGADAVAAFGSSPFVVAATAPAQPFARVFGATSAGGVALWSLVCVAELALFVAVLLRLDVAYEDAVLEASRKMQERRARMRAGEGAFVPSARSARKRRVPPFPRLGGAGPVARRQFLELVRNPASVLWTAGSLLACAGLILWAGARDGAADGGEASDGAWIGAVAAAVALTTFANQGFTFDFRRDLDRLADLRRLPVRAAALAAGQLVAPTFVFSVIQAATLALVAAFADLPGWVLGAAALALPPWNWLSAALDNALFLLFPYRIAPEDASKVPFLGRMMLAVTVKGAALGAVVIAAVVPVAAGAAIGGAAEPAGWAVAWLVLTGAAAASTWAVAWAFSRYDVSRAI